MLIPAEGLAGQEGIAEPFESDKGVSAPLGLGQGGAQLFHAGFQVGGNHGFLAVALLVVVGMIDSCSRRPGRTRGSVAVADALKVDAHLVLFRRPGVSRRVAALAAAVFTAQLDDGLVSGRRQEVQSARQAGVRGKRQFVQGFFDNLFCVGNVQVG